MTTIYHLHRATPAQQCPPCNSQCQQGRACNAQGASASSELLEDDEATEARFRAASRFWCAYMAVLLVAICAAIAHFLPALKTLAN